MPQVCPPTGTTTQPNMISYFGISARTPGVRSAVIVVRYLDGGGARIQIQEILQKCPHSLSFDHSLSSISGLHQNVHHTLLVQNWALRNRRSSQARRQATTG